MDDEKREKDRFAEEVKKLKEKIGEDRVIAVDEVIFIGTPEQKIKMKSLGDSIKEILGFIGEICDRYPKISGLGIDTTYVENPEDIKEVKIIFQEELNEEEKAEIMRLIAERFSRIKAKFISQEEQEKEWLKILE